MGQRNIIKIRNFFIKNFELTLYFLIVFYYLSKLIFVNDKFRFQEMAILLKL